MIYRDDFKVSNGSASTLAQDFKLSNKSRKNKKKKQHRKKKDSREFKDSTIPASEVNTVEVEGKKKKNKKDISEITYFKYNKKGYYANRYPKLPKK